MSANTLAFCGLLGAMFLVAIGNASLYRLEKLRHEQTAKRLEKVTAERDEARMERDAAEELVTDLKRTGFTHVELACPADALPTCLVEQPTEDPWVADMRARWALNYTPEQ